MRGVGGPLLCIGDLLSDVGERDGGDQPTTLQTSLSQPPSSSPVNLQPSDLTNLFQEKYDQLTEALAGTDHSWTALMLKLCTALETANKLVQSTNSKVGLLSEKVGELERIIKRADSAVGAAKGIQSSLSREGISQNIRQSRPDQ